MRIWKTHSRPNEICKFSIVQPSTLIFFQNAFLCLEIHENALVNGYQNTANLHCAHDENRETLECFSWAQKNNHRIGLTGVAQVLFWAHIGKNLHKTENEFGKDWSQREPIHGFCKVGRIGSEFFIPTK